MKKKLLIYFVFVVGLLLCCGNVYALNTADIFLNDTQVPTTTYITSNNGTNTFHLALLGDDSLDKYFQFTFCSDVVDVTDWTSAGTGNSVYIVPTNASCRYPNSSYTGGKIVYIYGSTNWNNLQNCSVQGLNCYIDIYFSYWQSNTLVSWTLLSSGLSSTPFTIDYATNSLINSNNQNTQNIINNNNTNTQSIINNQNQNSQAIINNITDGTPQTESESSSTLDRWKNLIPTNGVVSSLFLIPVNLIDKLVAGFNGTCQTFNLGNLMGTDLVLPCIQPANFFGSTLWGIIDLACCGFMLFSMFKKFVKVFSDITNLRDTPMNELYGGGR